MVISLWEWWFTSWWLNHPFEKICSSSWKSFPKHRVENSQDIWVATNQFTLVTLSLFFGNGQPSFQVALQNKTSQKFHVCFFACHHCCVVHKNTVKTNCTKMLGKPTKKIGSLEIASIQNSFGNLLLKTCCDLSPNEKNTLLILTPAQHQVVYTGMP